MHEVMETCKREAGLDESDVSMHAAPGIEIPGHAASVVPQGCPRIEPVIGLLVRSRIGRGASTQGFGYDEEVIHAKASQAYRGIQGCSTRAHYGDPRDDTWDIEPLYVYGLV
jgi:hypothetical protein